MQLQVETDELGSELEQLAKAKVSNWETWLVSRILFSFIGPIPWGYSGPLCQLWKVSQTPRYADTDSIDCIQATQSSDVSLSAESLLNTAACSMEHMILNKFCQLRCAKKTQSVADDEHFRIRQRRTSSGAAVDFLWFWRRNTKVETYTSLEVRVPYYIREVGLEDRLREVTYFVSSRTLKLNPVSIGVASYWSLGHVSPLDFQRCIL